MGLARSAGHGEGAAGGEVKIALASKCEMCYYFHMSEAQLNIRSTKAKNLASDLAKQERRTVSKIVESALEYYAKDRRKPNVRQHEASNFWRDLNKSLYPTGKEPDIDLEAIISEHRKPHDPIKL